VRRPALLLALALAGAPVAARAYSDGSTFARDPSVDSTGGGGGLYFTGSPRQHGLGCAVCHVGGPTDLQVEVSALLEGEPVDLLGRGYAPGGLYQLQVAFVEDRLVPEGGCLGHEDEPCDINTFALELLDGAAAPAGTLCPEAPSAPGCGGCRVKRAQGTLTDAGCGVIVADAFDDATFTWRNGVTRYTFFWQAPEEDVGPVTLYLAGVDGRGRESADGELTSYQNDGVLTAQRTLGAPAAGASCAAGPGASGAAALLLGLVIPLRRRARRRR
jgi:hypothetical protein